MIRRYLMRKIKFRAYDIDEKVMRKWEEVHFTKDIGDDYYMVGYKASTACVKYDNGMRYVRLEEKLRSKDMWKHLE